MIISATIYNKVWKALPVIAALMMLCPAVKSEERPRCVVADSVSRMPLAGASIFDHRGNALGMSGHDGRMPYVAVAAYPLTIRYLGYKELTVSAAAVAADTIFLQENPSELPEVVIESKSHKVLHMLAYVREYSTLSTYTDTVFLFREKMVDYMLTTDKGVRFRGWSSPRVLASRSYYRFIDTYGNDSVSDESNHHFSWSDWMGLPPVSQIPRQLIDAEVGSDTVRGKYRPAEITVRSNDRITVDVNVLNDSVSRRWVPTLNGFFSDDLDFETFKARFNYDNVAGAEIHPADLTSFSYNIESRGRGRGMFRFNRVDQPFFVTTYAEVYFLDKEYITVGEARKWAKITFKAEGIDIVEAPEAPELQASVKELVARVMNIDKGAVRLGVTPDHRLGSGRDSSKNFAFGRRVLTLLKDLVGITGYKSRKNMKKNWNEFNSDRLQRNAQRYAD
ncbi:MAG: carboxypeptidase-like regulatory domain-containing protein [Bacteroidales bacterium]|nr:carboxypeptidase-like regulatory domain-containing protein [Bacteroidales bacterium]